MRSPQAFRSQHPSYVQSYKNSKTYCECLLLALELNGDDRLATLVDDLEGEVLHVRLHLSIRELATDEALCVEDSVDRVHGDLVLG
jgi:hypothetical protein